MPDPAQLTPDIVKTLLREDRASELVGCHESATVEFKAQPYRLGEERQKFELAKDVSSLANAGGGVIVVGVTTERVLAQAADLATAITPIPDGLLAQPYLDVLSSWIYPPPEGCTFTQHPHHATPGHAIGVLEVPSQRASVKPFVVSRVVSPDDRHLGAVIGVFERRDAISPPLAASEIQALLRDGRLFRSAIDERGANPTSTPLDLVAIPAQETVAAAPVARRSNVRSDDATWTKGLELVSHLELTSEPFVMLTATPTPLVNLSDMFATEDNDFTRLIRRPPELRAHGFDLDAGQDVRIVRGESIRASVSAYKGLQLWRDGTLVFVGCGDGRFLSWPPRDSVDVLRVNPVTLIESTLLFCTMVHQLYSVPGRAPRSLLYGLHMRHLCVNTRRPLLPSGAVDAPAPWPPKEAPDCGGDFTVEDSPNAAPDAIASDLVKAVYAWFGHTYDSIPYADHGSIRGERLRAL